MHVDPARRPQYVVDDRPPEEVRPARLATRAQHDLGRILRPGELHQRGSHVGARQLVVLTAQLGEQLPLLGQRLAGRGAQPIGRADPHTEQLTASAGGHPGGAADHVVAAGRAGDRDDGSLARFPTPGDPVGLAVVLERFVDPIGDPHQRELPQRAEVPSRKKLASDASTRSGG